MAAKPLKLKFWVVMIGFIVLVFGVIGILLHDSCVTDVEGLTTGVEGELTQPMTIGARETAGAAFRAIAEFFVSIICPVLNFIDSVVPFGFALVMGVGVLLIIIGWVFVP
jgi:hypothetical protein